MQRLRSEAEREQGQALAARRSGDTRAFLPVDCQLFLVDLASHERERERVLAPEFYPFASCFEQRIGPSGGDRQGFRRPADGWAETWTPVS